MVNKHVFQQTPVDYEKLRPFFRWINSDIVKQTFDQTTQWGVALDSFRMKRHLKSRNPALIAPRRHEPVATDTIFSDTPAVDSCVKQAQVFVGRDSLVADVYPMKSGKQFVNTLEDPDGTMVSQPKKYNEKVKETYVKLFNTEPSKGLKTPLEKNDHPELDTSEILEGQEVNQYLIMVGQLQWLITLGRFDIQAQVITMSRFRAQPRKGHLEW